LFQLPCLPELLLQFSDCQAIKTVIKGTAVHKNAFTQVDLNNYQDAAAKPAAMTAMLNYYRNIFQAFMSQRNWSILNVPTLMIWGENDTALGKELTYDTSTYVRDLKIKYITYCGHWVQQEQPELVNQYIKDFLVI
jgi:epoxide hydrolase 4